MISKIFLRLAAALALGATVTFVPTAWAHVTLEWPAALAGTTYKAVFRIGHGCGATPTRQVAIDIPAGVRGARPLPRPGWTLDVQRAPLAQPYSNHGRTVTEDVVRVTWTARTREDMIEDAHFGEFVLLAGLPQLEGTLFWPVRQSCLEGSHAWTQTPAPGQSLSDVQSPAVALDILPARPAAAHSH